MRIWKAIFSRATFMVIVAIAEILFLFFLFGNFYTHAAWVETVLRVLSVIIVLTIIKNSRHLSSDLIWILLILLAPVPGTVVYLLLGANLITSRTFRNIVTSTGRSRMYYKQDQAILDEMSAKAPELTGQFQYISRNAGFPFYRNEGFDYYPSGEAGYPVMLEELKKAERFIFLEYFIIKEGAMWDGIMQILEQKAKEGLDIRVLYDDMGSFTALPVRYARELETKGIQCIPFNRINPILGTIMNHRDHRKILVIDGKVGFSGGINLSDEYINTVSRFGYWKDNVIRIRGAAVWSYTVMFLTHWNALRHTDENYEVFRAAEPARLSAPASVNADGLNAADESAALSDGADSGLPPLKAACDGYISPYGDTPLDAEITGQNIYMNILNQSNRYCYIMTPYLIVDTEFINALILAAKRGVDVRIITPGIPDKKIVWYITRSYYRQLISGGVQIYQYTPGFIHSKVFVSDDRIATVGTINLDYRSLYLHFENSTYLFDAAGVADVKADFLSANADSHQVSLEELGMNMVKEFLLSVLRIIAPLL